MHFTWGMILLTFYSCSQGVFKIRHFCSESKDKKTTWKLCKDYNLLTRENCKKDGHYPTRTHTLTIYHRSSCQCSCFIWKQQMCWTEMWRGIFEAERVKQPFKVNQNLNSQSLHLTLRRRENSIIKGSGFKSCWRLGQKQYAYIVLH